MTLIFVIITALLVPFWTLTGLLQWVADACVHKASYQERNYRTEAIERN